MGFEGCRVRIVMWGVIIEGGRWEIENDLRSLQIKVVLLTVKIVFIRSSLTAVQIYDFHIFLAVVKKRV